MNTLPTNEQFIALLKPALDIIAVSGQGFRKIEVSYEIFGDIPSLEFRVVDGGRADKAPNQTGKTLFEVDEKFQNFDPSAAARAKLDKLEADAAKLRAEIAAEMEEK